MNTRLWLLFAIGSLAYLSPDVVEAQCLDADHFSANMLAYADALATSSDSVFVETRDRYGILPVLASEVELVTDSETCKTAGLEYKKTLDLSGEAPLVHVVRIGTRYIVMNPDQRAGEFIVYVVFDDQFSKLATFIG